MYHVSAYSLKEAVGTLDYNSWFILCYVLGPANTTRVDDSVTGILKQNS